MKGRLLSMLDPLGPLSLLNPRNFVHPLSSLMRDRRPPLDDLDDQHGSLLKKLYNDKELEDIYGDSVWAERVPFPNMEWWWNAIDFGDQLSLITNVHLFAVPVLGWVVQGTLAIRDRYTKQVGEAHAKGEISSDDRCHFSANGWNLRIDPDPGGDARRRLYSIAVRTNTLKVDIEIPLGRVTYIGDGDQPRGWADNNPQGFIPYWASYRCRFGEASGKIIVNGESYNLANGKARFDHQSLHWSAKDIGNLSPAVLAEAAITRPQWLWYHARLEGLGANPLNLTAYEIRNGHTRKVIKRFAAIADDDGNVVQLDTKALSFRPRSHEKGPGIKFAAPASTALGLRAQDVELTFEFFNDLDWTVRYPIVGPLCYRAVETCGRIKRVDGIEGTVTREVVDLLKSITVDS
jgi:hypothetical protein